MKFRKVLLLVLSLALVNFSSISNISIAETIINGGEVTIDGGNKLSTPLTSEKHAEMTENWKIIISLLKEQGLTVSTMESASIGQVISSFLNLPGTSSLSPGGAVAYTNEMKIKYGVDADVIDKHTVESPQAAREMARAIAAWYGTTFGISVTGASMSHVDTCIYDTRTDTYYDLSINLPTWQAPVSATREGNNYSIVMEIQTLFHAILTGAIGPDSIANAENVEANSTLGEPVEFGGHTQYVDEDGVTSIEYSAENADENGMIWLKEESEGTSNVYGIEYRADLFEEGSTFHVEWVAKGSDEHADIMQAFDDNHEENVEGDNVNVFNMGVTRPDGTEYTNIGGTANVVIAHGDDWDNNDINAIHPVKGGIDETVVVNETATMTTPDGDMEVTEIAVTHFSPYVIYDKVDSVSPAIFWAIGGVGALAILFVVWQIRKAKSHQAGA